LTKVNNSALEACSFYIQVEIIILHDV